MATINGPELDRIWIVSSGRIAGVVHGALPNKSNSRRIVTLGGKPRSIKSEEALKFLGRFVGLIMASGFSRVQLDGATNEKDMRRGKPFLFLEAKVFGQSLERDLDCELLCDALQHVGLIENDRAIRQKHYYWELDKVNPRVEFEVGYLEKGPKVERG